MAKKAAPRAVNKHRAVVYAPPHALAKLTWKAKGETRCQQVHKDKLQVYSSFPGQGQEHAELQMPAAAAGAHKACKCNAA